MHMASSRSGGLLSTSKQQGGLLAHVLHPELSAPTTKATDRPHHKLGPWTWGMLGLTCIRLQTTLPSQQPYNIISATPLNSPLGHAA